MCARKVATHVAQCINLTTEDGYEFLKAATSKEERPKQLKRKQGKVTKPKKVTTKAKAMRMEK